VFAVAWEELLPAFGELLDWVDGLLDEADGLLDGFAAAVSARRMRRASCRMPP
jgi:hypothetical protein